MKITRTFDLLERYASLPDKEDALCHKQAGQWKKYSSREYCELTRNLSYGLHGLGLRKGDMVITVSSNRPEWNFADLAMAMLGIIHVPVFPSLTTSEYEYIIRNCRAKAVFVSDAKLLKLVRPAAIAADSSMHIFTFDRIEGSRHWLGLAEDGSKSSEETRNTVHSISRSIQPGDCAVLIYTSGTTGKPKGVMLSHRNLVGNFLAAAEVFGLKPEDKFMSILPLCHVGGRMGNYQTQYSNTSIYYVENMGAISANMQEIKPDGFDAVPRILEKFYNGIISRGKQLTGIKKKFFFAAVRLGDNYKPFGENGWFYELKLALADKLVFSKWRAALGNRVRLVGCGGASLSPKLERIFWAAGIKIINMYGLTETSPIITINRQHKGALKLGSVGSVIEGVDVKIAGDGEILCKGHNVMLGYYNDPDLTASAFDEEGWFRTGDIGHISGGRFLMVTDRKKEIFKLSSGKFIAPQLIENVFKESPMIDQIMIVGEHEKFVSALISPDLRYFEKLEAQKAPEARIKGLLLESEELVAAITSEVDKYNKAVSPHERILRFRLVADEWSPATGELSPTLKLKRQVIMHKYHSLLEEVYRK